MREGGYLAYEMREGTPSQVSRKSPFYDCAALKEGGYTPMELLHGRGMAACYPASEMYQAGFTVADLAYASDNSAAYNAWMSKIQTSTARSAPPPPAAGYASRDIRHAFGIPDENDVDDTQYGNAAFAEGFHASQLVAVGYDCVRLAERLRNAIANADVYDDMAVMQMTCTETARELSDFGYLPVLLAVEAHRSGDVVWALLQAYPEGARTFKPGGFRELPLHVAAEKRCHTEIIEALIKSHSAACQERTSFGYLPLHIAAESGAPQAAVAAILKAYPEAVSELTAGSKTPKQLTADRAIKKLLGDEWA